MRRTSSRAAALTVAVVMALGACADSGSNGTTSTGADTTAAAPTTTTTPAAAEPATLRMAVTGGWGDVVEPLRASLVDGDPKIEIDAEWYEAHDGVDIEREIVAAVVSGELDIGYVGTRVLGDLGAPDFNALTAPFLVDSYAVQQAVLDSDIPGRMLAGLDDLGVTGLTVGAGRLRRPLAVGGPLLDAGDYGGITFQTYRSALNAATITALGATHTDVYGDERDEGLIEGTIDAVENSLPWALNVGLTPYVTLNAALWPGTGVLLANPASLAALSGEQRARLDAAVADSFATAADIAAADADLLAEMCSFGSRFAEASDTDRAALRAAVEPVYDELEADAATAAYLAEIEEMAEGAAPDGFAIPDGCTGPAPGPDDEVALGTDDPAVLNGTFTFEWTVDELHQIEWMTEDMAVDNAAVLELTFEDGRYDMVWTTGADPGASCPGRYGVTGDRLVMVATSDITEWDCGGDSLGLRVVDATWELAGDTLTLSEFTLPDEPDVSWFNATYMAKPMTRIG